MKRLFITGFLFYSFSAMSQNKQKQLAIFFEQLHNQGKLNGNVLIASGDTILYQRSFGMAEHSTNRSLNDSTIFELASVSKQFTAIGIVIAKEKGLLNYSDSLRKFFPELPYQHITVQQLLHHTSGLPDYIALMMENWDTSRIATNKDMILMLAQHKPALLFSPGQKWEYSNTGYALLASIIEKVSGKSYGEFLQENIFTPTDMMHTEVYRRRYEKRNINNYAYGYMWNETDKKFSLPDDIADAAKFVYCLDGIVGDGTVNSTTRDLLKWSLALDNNLLVPEKVKGEIFTPGLLNNKQKHSYGYGWMLARVPAAGRIANHGGSWPGYGTFIEKHIDTKKTIIILNNHDQPDIPFQQLKNIIYGIKEPAKKEIKLAENVLQEYVGSYQLTPDFAIKIFIENGRLLAQATGQGSNEIFAEKEDLFFLKVVEAKLRFNRNEKKEVVSVVLLQNGQELKGDKIN